jgi:hypothetical protein
MVNPPETSAPCTSRIPFILQMSSTASKKRNLPRLTISSNFDGRVHVVGGCREIRISPHDNRNGCDR